MLLILWWQVLLNSYHQENKKKKKVCKTNWHSVSPYSATDSSLANTELLTFWSLSKSEGSTEVSKNLLVTPNQWLGSFVQEGRLPETFRISELGHESWQKKSLYEKEKNNFAIANIKSLQVWWTMAHEILINPCFLRDVREGGVLFIHLKNFKKCIWISELSEETWTA